MPLPPPPPKSSGLGPDAPLLYAPKSRSGNEKGAWLVEAGGGGGVGEKRAWIVVLLSAELPRDVL